MRFPTFEKCQLIANSFFTVFPGANFSVTAIPAIIFSAAFTVLLASLPSFELNDAAEKGRLNEEIPTAFFPINDRHNEPESPASANFVLSFGLKVEKTET